MVEDGNQPSTSAPPLLDDDVPTAALPARRRQARAVPAVPAPPRAERLGGSVAARLAPDGAAPRRLTTPELLRVGASAVRVLALTAGVLVASPTWDTTTILLLVVAAVITVLRALTSATSAVVVDVLAILGTLAASQGIDGPFALYGAATMVATGIARGMASGLTAAAVVAAVGVVAGPGFEVAADARATAVAWIALDPVAAALGALLANVLLSGQAALLSTNRILADLERLTRAAPQTLSPAKVAREAAAEFRQVVGGDVAIVLFEREGTLLELGRDGSVDAGPHLVLDEGWEHLVDSRGPTIVDQGSFPVRLTRQLPPVATWLAVPLRSREVRVGLVVVGASEIDVSRTTRARLATLAGETALALDNTQLFARIEDAATAAERQRLASDLHDGVAQQLTHVRFELELLARRVQEQGVREELGRLARVADRATDDVRAAIRGLQATALAQGLVPAVRALVADLDGASGPSLTMEVRGAADLDPDTTAELYRIVQEALSNALRHADAGTVVVEIDVVGDLLVLVVEDDGDGLPGSAGSRTGLGLRTMRARAERIGGTCTIRRGDEAGTRVEVRLPLEVTA